MPHVKEVLVLSQQMLKCILQAMICGESYITVELVSYVGIFRRVWTPASIV